MRGSRSQYLTSGHRTMENASYANSDDCQGCHAQRRVHREGQERQSGHQKSRFQSFRNRLRTPHQKPRHGAFTNDQGCAPTTVKESSSTPKLNTRWKSWRRYTLQIRAGGSQQRDPQYDLRGPIADGLYQSVGQDLPRGRNRQVRPPGVSNRYRRLCVYLRPNLRI